MATKEKITEVKIDYTPRNWAKRFHNSILRWVVLIIHRRGGKTTAAINHLNRDALRKPKTRYAYIAPTFTQAKRIVWSMVKDYTAGIPNIKYNESELKITYPNGSELLIVGSDNPDSLRGIALWGAFLDEYQKQSPITYTQVISKCLADHRGYCIFGGTPAGKNHFYKLYNIAKQNPDEYELVFQTIDDSLATEQGEVIENLREALKDDRRQVEQGLMTQDELLQEWYNSFEAALKGAVYAQQIADMRQKKRICNVPYDPALPVFTVWDLGVGDAMAIGFFQRTGPETRMIEYYENTGLGLNFYIKYVKEKEYVYSKHFAPHDISVREMSTGETRLQAAEKLGLKFEIVPSIPLEDGIDKARAFLTKIWIDQELCETFIDFIGQYHYVFSEKTNTLSVTPLHDYTSHAADMLRYAAIVEKKMVMSDPLPDPNDIYNDSVVVHDEYAGKVDPTNTENRHPMLKDIDLAKM